MNDRDWAAAFPPQWIDTEPFAKRLDPRDRKALDYHILEICEALGVPPRIFLGGN